MACTCLCSQHFCDLMQHCYSLVLYKSPTFRNWSTPAEAKRSPFATKAVTSPLCAPNVAQGRTRESLDRGLRQTILPFSRPLNSNSQLVLSRLINSKVDTELAKLLYKRRGSAVSISFVEAVWRSEIQEGTDPSQPRLLFQLNMVYPIVSLFQKPFVCASCGHIKPELNVLLWSGL